MTEQEKQLLLKDLCARLPYGVKCHFKYGTSEDDIILKCIDGNVARFDYGWYGKFHVIIDPQYIKPYLRPMSSMTEEEKKKVHYLVESHKLGNCSRSGAISDYLNSIHIDYRGLIEKGLAIEAPEEMYN